MAHRKQVLASGLVASIAALLFLLQVIRPAASQLTHGFSSYYTASRLVREGWSVADFYDDGWFQSQTERLGFVGAEDVYNLNPPSTALLFWPLSGLSPEDGKAVWTGVNLLLLGLALGGMVRIVRGGPVEVAVGVVLIVSFQPVRENVRLGQVYVLLLALEVALLWTFLDRRAAVAGFWLGMMIGLKTAGAGLVLLLVSQQRWRELFWTVLTVGGVVVASLLLVGIAPWLRYLALLSRFGAHPELAVTAYQSVPGLFLHLFQPDDIWNISPLLNAPALATCLIVASALTTIGLTVQQTWHCAPLAHRDRALAFAAWATLDVALSPVSEDYHYTLLLVPIAILLADWRDARFEHFRLAILVVGIGLIGSPLPYKAPPLTVGGWAVLAYPKLYGALLLWGLATSALANERRRSRRSNLVHPQRTAAPESV